MTENMREWLRRLYKDAIDEHLVAASNERLWSLGSDTDEDTFLHMQNAEEHWEFANILRNMMDEI